MRKLIVNFIVGCISLCLALIIAEFVLRLIIPLNTGTSFQFRIPHPILGWKPKPGISYNNELPETTVDVTYNTKGYRDVEHTFEKPDGVFRILVLGDSFMEAYSVELKESFSRQLEKLIRKAGCVVEVINLGVGGYGTLQEYLVLEEIGRKYSPDLVLLGFYVQNDVRNNSLELESILKGDKMKISSRPFIDPAEPALWEITQVDFEYARGSYVKAQVRLDSLRSRLENRFALIRLTNMMTTQQNLKNQGTHLKRISKERDLSLLGVNYCIEASEYTKAWKITEQILLKLKKNINMLDSRLVVFSVPALMEVNLDYMKKIRAKSVNPDALCFEEAPGYKRLSFILANLEIDFINLLPDFRRVSRNEDVELFWFSDKHWNHRGHALAAKLVLSDLVERELLPIP